MCVRMRSGVCVAVRREELWVNLDVPAWVLVWVHVRVRESVCACKSACVSARKCTEHVWECMWARVQASVCMYARVCVWALVRLTLSAEFAILVDSAEALELSRSAIFIPYHALIVLLTKSSLNNQPSLCWCYQNLGGSENVLDGRRCVCGTVAF